MTENTQIKEQISIVSEKINEVKKEIHKKVVGQDELINSILIGLFGKGHILIEGVPGLAKTLTVDTLAKSIDLDFNRIQFTPDLLPSDLIGTEIYNPKTGEFSIKKGPIFTNIVLADEINRSPSKVQSALLEAMAEKQITIGNKTYKLEKPFIVLATQNPVEQSGTYNLPEAQLDRFMFKVNITYQDKNIEKEIYKKINEGFDDIKINKVLNKEDIFKIWDLLGNIYVSDNIYEYISNIIDSTRHPENYQLQEIKKYIQYGISPRGGIALLNGAKVNALMNGRDFVLPEDIKDLALLALSHRIILSYEAISDNIKAEEIIKKIIDTIKIV